MLLPHLNLLLQAGVEGVLVLDDLLEGAVVAHVVGQGQVVAEVDDPRADVVEEGAVVADHHQRRLLSLQPLAQVPLEPHDRLRKAHKGTDNSHHRKGGLVEDSNLSQNVS